MRFMFVLIPSLMILCGIVGIVSPRAMWYLQEGWKYQNVEPSSAALVMYRIGSIVAIVAGSVFLVRSRNGVRVARFR